MIAKQPASPFLRNGMTCARGGDVKPERFDDGQGRAAGLRRAFPVQAKRETRAMNQAQLGLLIVTPMLVGVAFLLHRQGVMSRGGVVLASLASLGTAAWMFLTQ